MPKGSAIFTYKTYLSIFPLADTSDELLDRPPFGTIRLDENGFILAYNRWESELSRRSVASVFGRPFFDGVASCKNIRSFIIIVNYHKRYEVSGTREYDVVFKFNQCVLVLI